VNRNGPFLTTLRDFAEVEPDAMRSMIAMTSDIALVVSADGVVQDVYFGADLQPANDPQSWSGLEIDDIVTEESRGKVADMLARARDDEAPRWREINHVDSGGEEFPVRYAAVRTGTRATSSCSAATCAWSPSSRSGSSRRSSRWSRTTSASARSRRATESCSRPRRRRS
jgi:hypothetical protein